MAFQPLADRVLIKRIEAKDKTKGGLHIPSSAQEKNTLCAVVAVGPGKIDDNGRLHEPRVKTGDEVMIGKWSGDEIQLIGVTHLVLKESDILGIWVDD